MRKWETPRDVCFIASGAVEIEMAGQKHRLGRGEMFGQLALLSRQTRHIQVTAISHCALLVLDEPSFRRLMKRSETIRNAVAESARRRGVTIDEPGLSG